MKSSSRTSRTLTTAAAVALAAVAIAPAASAAPSGGPGAHVASSTSTLLRGSGELPKRAMASGEHVLRTPYQQQTVSYWCGPTSVSMALAARGISVSPATLAAEMGTSPATGSSVDGVLGALRNHSGAPYEATPGSGAAGAEGLWNAVMEDVNGGFPVVAAVHAGPGQYPTYPQYNAPIAHIIVIDGYDTDYNTVHISDPDNFNGYSHYWLDLSTIAPLVSGGAYYFW